MMSENKSTLLPIHQTDFSEDASPKVSVVVMAYNQENFIRKCLGSILMQKVNFPVEIIIHDDASKDKTSKIISAYAKKFPKIIKVFLQKENQFSKQIKLRPHLLKKCKGEYIAHCDGDDFWTDPDKLRKQVEFLDKHAEYVMSFHDAVAIDKMGKLIVRNVLSKSSRRDYTKAELRILKWGWMLFGTIVHRNVAIEFPPEYNLVPNGDNFYPMLLATFGAAKFHDDVGPLAYVQHDGGIWSSKSKIQKNEMHMRSYFAIVGYFVRMGDREAAKALISSRLLKYIAAYIN